MKNIFENVNVGKLGLAVLGAACAIGSAFVGAKQKQAQKEELIEEVMKRMTERNADQG